MVLCHFSSSPPPFLPHRNTCSSTLNVSIYILFEIGIVDAIVDLFLRVLPFITSEERILIACTITSGTFAVVKLCLLYNVSDSCYSHANAS